MCHFANFREATVKKRFFISVIPYDVNRYLRYDFIYQIPNFLLLGIYHRTIVAIKTATKPLQPNRVYGTVEFEQFEIFFIFDAEKIPFIEIVFKVVKTNLIGTCYVTLIK